VILWCRPAGGVLRTGVVFWRHLRVCPSAQNLENYWSEIDVTWREYEPWWTLALVGSWWYLTLTFDPESYFRAYLSYNFWMAWISHFVFAVDIRFENIYVPVQFRGHRAKVKVKVTAARNGRSQVCVTSDAVQSLLSPPEPQRSERTSPLEGSGHVCRHTHLLVYL